MSSRPLNVSGIEGALVYSGLTIPATCIAGPNGAIQAGPQGTAIGRFAWVRPDGVALNQRTSPDDAIGIVLPEFGPGVDWRRVFYDDVSKTCRIRQGLNISILTAGNVLMRFPGGARPGNQVYANLLDGSAISGPSVSGEVTRWFVASAAPPGQLAIITTWSKKA